MSAPTPAVLAERVQDLRERVKTLEDRVEALTRGQIWVHASFVAGGVVMTLLLPKISHVLGLS